jgi:hypothetical protein
LLLWLLQTRRANSGPEVQAVGMFLFPGYLGLPFFHTYLLKKSCLSKVWLLAGMGRGKRGEGEGEERRKKMCI